MRGTAVVFIIVGFISVLCKIAWEDYQTGKIPDRQNGILLLLGLAAMWSFPEKMSAVYLPGPSVAGMFVVSLPLFLLGVILPGSLGGGDVKLMAAGGFFLGVRGILLAAVLGFFCAGLYGAGLLLCRRAGRKSTFPLGPFLCLGMLGAFVILCAGGSYLIL